MPVALITGITGQTGSYLAEQLDALDWELHGIVRPDEASPGVLPGGARAISADLGDEQSIRSAIGACSPDVVFNLAAISSVAQSWEEPVLTARVNGIAVAVMLDELWTTQARSGIARTFVQASSGEIFGTAEEERQTESTRVKPTNPYGASKAYAHHLVGVYRAIGMRASSAILYNHESPRRPTAFVTRKITSTVARIHAGLATELVLGDLSIRRDWGWAPDFADALQRIAAADRGGDYVVATGEDHSIEEFVELAFASADIKDWRSYVRSDPSFKRPVDAATMRGDASAIRRDLAWSPTRSFRQIVAAMVEHDIAELAARGASS